MDRLGAAGSTFPDIAVVFSDDEADCEGHPGTFDQRRHPWRVSICSDLDFVIPTSSPTRGQPRTSTTRAGTGYIAARGLTNWADDDAPRRDRGTEDAAFIVQQNLTRRAVDLSPPTWVDRREAYELLTGRRSPMRPDA